jgi:ribosomal protein L11 methyltransferase
MGNVKAENVVQITLEMTSSAPLWKAFVTLNKDRAADVVAVFELAPPTPQAVLIAEDPFGTDATVEALYQEPPDANLLSKLVGLQVSVEPLPDQDWIRQSQLGLPPVRAGRFFVYGSHDAGRVPDGVIPIRIEAGLAFGTGHHETTTLCLEAITLIGRRGRPVRVLDLGCGTGVLAIAAAKLWRRRVLASDIDPVAAEVARENARMNGVAPLVRVSVADGLRGPTIQAGGPYDLIVANILALPLQRLAPALSAALARGGTAILSGLLRDQEQQVASAYRAQGLAFRRALRKGPWSALVLKRSGR